MDSAQVTAGGILTREFDERTMESRLVPGLYACGEVLDVDGDCGGGKVDLLGNQKTALYAVIGVICWQFIPFYMVYYMAGVDGSVVFEKIRSSGKVGFGYDAYNETYVDMIPADPEMTWTLDGEREDGHREITVTNNHLAYRLVKTRDDDA